MREIPENERREMDSTELQQLYPHQWVYGKCIDLNINRIIPYIVEISNAEVFDIHLELNTGMCRIYTTPDDDSSEEFIHVV